MNARINVDIDTSMASARLNELGEEGAQANNRIASGATTAQQKFDELYATTERLARQFVTQFSNRGPDEMVRSVERQISAMKRKARIAKEIQLEEIAAARKVAEAKAQEDHEKRMGFAEKNLASGKIDQETFDTVESASTRARDSVGADFDAQEQQVRNDQREQNQQADLLREILNELRSSAESELASDRAGVERELASGRHDTLTEGDDEMEHLRRAMQRRSKKSSGAGGTLLAGDFGQREINAGMGALSSSNEIYAAAALAGMIPVIGAGLAKAMSKAFGEADEFQTARGAGRAFGNDDFSPSLKGQRFGIKAADNAKEFTAPAIKAQGRWRGGENLGDDALALNKSAAVDTGTTMELIRSLRTSNNKDIIDIAGTLTATMQSNGAMDQGDFTKLNEYLEISTSIQNDQLLRLNSIDTNTNLRMVTGLSGMGGAMGDPRVASDVTSKIDQSMRNPQNEFIEAIQFEVLSKLKPQASLWELKKMKSQGIQNEEFTDAMVNRAIQQGGGNEDLEKEGLTALLGMQGQEEIVEQLLSGFKNNSNSLYGDLEDRGDFKGELNSRAPVVTGQLKGMTAQMSDVFAIQGDRLVSELSGVLEPFGGMPGMVSGMFDATIMGVGFMGDIVKLIERGLTMFSEKDRGPNFVQVETGVFKYLKKIATPVASE